MQYGELHRTIPKLGVFCVSMNAIAIPLEAYKQLLGFSEVFTLDGRDSSYVIYLIESFRKRKDFEMASLKQNQDLDAGRIELIGDLRALEKWIRDNPYDFEEGVQCRRWYFIEEKEFQGEVKVYALDIAATITNVPMPFHHHSQSHAVGYMGSGPAELALHILHWYLPCDRVPCLKEKLYDGSEVSAIAWALHQQFKRDFLAGMKVGEPGLSVVPGSEIVEWLCLKVPELAVRKFCPLFPEPEEEAFFLDLRSVKLKPEALVGETAQISSYDSSLEKESHFGTVVANLGNNKLLIRETSCQPESDRKEWEVFEIKSFYIENGDTIYYGEAIDNGLKKVHITVFANEELEEDEATLC